MKARFLLTLGALAAASAGLIIADTSSAGANVEATFTAHVTNIEYVTSSGSSLTAPATLVPGDRTIVRFDDIQGTNVVGFTNAVCTVTFNNNELCDAVSSTTNVGDLSISLLLRGAAVAFPSVYDGSINGGTFAYRNAHGDFHAVVQSNGDIVITVNFVTT
jgi:hypothetical protein